MWLGLLVVCVAGKCCFCNDADERHGRIFPDIQGGQNVPSILFASIFIWGLTLLVNNGVEGAERHQYNRDDL